MKADENTTMRNKRVEENCQKLSRVQNQVKISFLPEI